MKVKDFGNESKQEVKKDSASSKKFYITTSIIYTNAKPHIGFALELIQADVIARFHRLKGEDVFFLTGSDEHGIKNQRAAEEAKKQPQEFVDEMTNLAIELAKRLNISNNDYIRTTDKKRHWPTAQEIWNLLVKSRDIYKKKYKDLYCSGCESFKTKKELVDGKCPDHNKEPELIEEENYFFKLSKYSKRISEIIEKDEYLILPKSRKNEILNFIKDGLEDISFSRSVKSLQWGVPVPNDESQIMYVWSDALTNYLSGIGHSYDKNKFKKYWPADIHLIGKDILRFHAVIWPAILLSAGISLPKKVFVHGWITSQGRKMSKTIGNVIDPVDQLNKYGTDAFRYFLIREIPSDGDGDYTEKPIVNRINNELADELGNLVYRVLSLTEKYFEGIIPEKDDELSKIFLDALEKIEDSIEKFRLHDALNEIWRLVSESNKYINEKEPWKIKDKKKLSKIIYNLLESIRVISILINPFIPETSEKILRQLGLDKKHLSFKNLKWGLLKPGSEIKKEKILFEKIDIKEKDPFSKLDLKVGEIQEVEDVSKSDMLYALTVDINSERRQIVAGMKMYYKRDELVGKKVVVLCNLEPVIIRGVKSEGMLLAGENKDVGLLIAEKSEAGDKVFVEGIETEPKESIKLKDFEEVGLKVKNGFVVYKNKKLRTEKEEIKVERVKKGIVR